MKVFVSSVVKGFEPYRKAARRGIESIDAEPVMSEDFGARPYSSERACLTEIDGSDVFVLLLGERYGYETDAGISVTQQEFRYAKDIGLPILVFVQDISMEERQAAFRQEVEAYHSGFCREQFGSEEQLKDAVVKQLVRFERSLEAVSESRFRERLEESIEPTWHGTSRDATFKFAFLPQPAREVDLRDIESERDTIFSRLASARLVTLKHGYEASDAPNHVGISSGNVKVRYYDDGLVTYEAPASVENASHSFSSWYVPPSHVTSMANACYVLISANGGWCHIGLSGMENAVMEELPPESTNSFSGPDRFGRETQAERNKLLFPCTEGAFTKWVDKVVARLQRQFGRVS